MAETKPKIVRARSLRRSASIAENRLWFVLRNRAIDGHRFVRQMPIGPYFADFVCREAALIIEVDGGQHSGSRNDELRTKYLNAEGYSVLRFWNDDILTNRAGVVEAIMLTLAGSPSPDWRYAPADLSPTGRGIRGADAALSAKLANASGQSSSIALPAADRSVAQQPGDGSLTSRVQP